MHSVKTNLLTIKWAEVNDCAFAVSSWTVLVPQEEDALFGNLFSTSYLKIVYSLKMYNLTHTCMCNRTCENEGGSGPLMATWD